MPKKTVNDFLDRHRRTRESQAKKKSGAWFHHHQVIRNFVNVFNTQVVSIARTKIKRAATDFANSVKMAFWQQRYKTTWQPLSERYMAYKKKKGLDLRTLIATGTYVRSIEARPRRYRGVIVSYEVGPPRGIHQPSGLTYRKLARLHEYGSRAANIPPRPIWNPAWQEFMKRKAGRVVREINKETVRYARRRIDQERRKV